RSRFGRGGLTQSVTRRGSNATWSPIDRRDHSNHNAIATRVRVTDETVRVTTNTPTDWLSSSHMATAALRSWVTAQSSVIWVKKRGIGALEATCSGIGQKSRARRPASG